MPRTGDRNARGHKLEAAARNGLIDRRALLAGDRGCLELEEPMPVYQTPSKFEAKVARTLSNPNFEPRNSHARTPHHMLEGATTPNGLHFAINHGGVPN